MYSTTPYYPAASKLQYDAPRSMALYHSPDTPTDDLSVKAVIPTDYQLV